ncbi:MAG: NAD(P)-binding domain-containing protein, partial [Leptospiraceae bacterium]|nr:NAD(P)-binding domain-containing protein [Leptospiraceae bacterium]
MKIGIIGSGVVGRALGSGFARIGHNVTIGTRNTEKEELLAWKKETGGTLASTEVAAKQAEIAILATSWAGTREAVEQAGLANLQGKLLIDVTNPLDFSGGGPALS